MAPRPTKNSNKKVDLEDSENIYHECSTGEAGQLTTSVSVVRGEEEGEGKAVVNDIEDNGGTKVCRNEEIRASEIPNNGTQSILKDSSVGNMPSSVSGAGVGGGADAGLGGSRGGCCCGRPLNQDHGMDAIFDDVIGLGGTISGGSTGNDGTAFERIWDLAKMKSDLEAKMRDDEQKYIRQEHTNYELIQALKYIMGGLFPKQVNFIREASQNDNCKVLQDCLMFADDRRLARELKANEGRVNETIQPRGNGNSRPQQQQQPQPQQQQQQQQLALSQQHHVEQPQPEQHQQQWIQQQQQQQQLQQQQEQQQQPQQAYYQQPWMTQHQQQQPPQPRVEQQQPKMQQQQQQQVQQCSTQSYGGRAVEYYMEINEERRRRNVIIKGIPDLTYAQEQDAVVDIMKHIGCGRLVKYIDNSVRIGKKYHNRGRLVKVIFNNQEAVEEVISSSYLLANHYLMANICIQRDLPKSERGGFRNSRAIGEAAMSNQASAPGNQRTEAPMKNKGATETIITPVQQSIVPAVASDVPIANGSQTNPNEGYTSPVRAIAKMVFDIPVRMLFGNRGGSSSGGTTQGGNEDGNANANSVSTTPMGKGSHVQPSEKNGTVGPQQAAD